MLRTWGGEERSSFLEFMCVVHLISGQLSAQDNDLMILRIKTDL